MKTSIFSREYDRKKKRKKKIIISLVIVAFAAGAIFFVSTKNKKWIGAEALNKITYKVHNIFKFNKNAKQTVDESNNSKESENQDLAKDVEETGYDVKLSGGKEIKIIYEVKDNEKIFKYITPMDSPVQYNISPSGKAIVIMDTKTQDIFYTGQDGKLKDISYKQYTSTNGNTFTKDSYLKTNPQYIWNDSPKFIDEENIIYISQLPWFFNDKTTKYVWITNIKNNSYRCFENISGESFKFNGVNNSLISVNIDGKNEYISANGEVSE